MEAFQNIIFSSHDEFFRSPQGAIKQDDSVFLRVLVSKALNVYGVSVRLWCDGEEKYLNLIHGKEYNHTPYGDFLEEYYINVSCETIGLLWYQFVVNTGTRPYFVCNSDDGLGGTGCVYEHQRLDKSFQITVIDKNFAVPDWAKGAVMYQIFPDRFNRCDGSGDISGRKFHENWNDMPDYKIIPEKGYYPADDFFGGNLKGIENKLDYIKSLGVNVIYLNPIFESYSNHRYDTGDYEKVDKTLGTEEDFTSLCEKAGQKGIRVILDGVFSHTGSDSKYFNRDNSYNSLGAYQSTDSPYYSWYDFEQFPDKYDCWWGVWSLPCVKETEESYRKYILSDENSIVKKWLKKGASGWRLDVADELPDSFIKELRFHVKQSSPDALVIGEVWEDASNKVSYGQQRQFLYGNELDTVMNYPLRNAIISYLLQKTDGETFTKTVYSLRENYPKESFYSLMNFISTHDVERIITRLGHDTDGLSREEQAEFSLTDEEFIIGKALAKLAALLVFSLPGMPCVYYGDEMSLIGCKDPFNRKPFPWNSPDEDMLAWYRRLGEIHNCECFKQGDLRIESAGSLLSVRRKYENERRYILINATEETVETLLDQTYFDGEPEIILESGLGTQFQQRDRGYYVLIPPRSAIVFETK